MFDFNLLCSKWLDMLCSPKSGRLTLSAGRSGIDTSMGGKLGNLHKTSSMHSLQLLMHRYTPTRLQLNVYHMQYFVTHTQPSKLCHAGVELLFCYDVGRAGNGCTSPLLAL